MSLNTFLSEIETAASKAGIAIEQGLLFLAHFSQSATPELTTATTIAEAVSGNEALIPITEAVSAAVEAGGKEILANQGTSTINQLTGLATNVEVATGNADLVKTTETVGVVTDALAQKADATIQATIAPALTTSQV
jgi:hypothetical protein